ncbi:MAG: queuosine salvage family protein, partial [Candidatus Saccharimonas sp.]
YAPALQQVVDPWEALVARGENDFVSVNQDVLETIAAQNPELKVPDWRFPGDNAEDDWGFATQVVVSSVINFHFLNRNRDQGENWSMTDPSGNVLTGSNALLTRFNQRFPDQEDITSPEIRKLIGNAEFDAFLPGIPLAMQRRELLEDFAHGLANYFDGSVRNLIESTKDADDKLRLFNDGHGLTETLLNTTIFERAFTDTSQLGDLTFPFNKRANLAPLLMYGRSTTSDTLPSFADIDQSGVIPDYRLPQAFRSMGAIAYSPKLAELVDNWKPVMKNSAEEVEIRGATSYATAYLLKRINEIRAEAGQTPYNMAHIDFMLWKMGRNLKDTPSMPHFTETTAY